MDKSKQLELTGSVFANTDLYKLREMIYIIHSFIESINDFLEPFGLKCKCEYTHGLSPSFNIVLGLPLHNKTKMIVECVFISKTDNYCGIVQKKDNIKVTKQTMIADSIRYNPEAFQDALCNELHKMLHNKIENTPSDLEGEIYLAIQENLVSTYINKIPDSEKST